MSSDAELEGRPWDEIEIWRAWQERRQLWMQIGQIFCGLAWLRLHKFSTGDWFRDGKLAAGMLVRAVDCYQEAGMGRKAEAVSRYLGRLRREYWRRAGR